MSSEQPAAGNVSLRPKVLNFFRAIQRALDSANLSVIVLVALHHAQLDGSMSASVRFPKALQQKYVAGVTSTLHDNSLVIVFQGYGLVYGKKFSETRANCSMWHTSQLQHVAHESQKK